MTSPRLAILAAPIVLVGTLALAGCGTVPKPAEPKIVVDTAHDPVAASCVPSTLGPAPAYPEAGGHLAELGQCAPQIPHSLPDALLVLDERKAHVPVAAGAEAHPR